MHKTPYVFPIVGGRKVSHLEGNIEALRLELSKEDMAEIEKVYEFDPGFPHSLLFRAVPWDVNLTGQDVFITKLAARLDTLPKPSVSSSFLHSVTSDQLTNVQPIKPHVK